MLAAMLFTTSIAGAQPPRGEVKFVHQTYASIPGGVRFVPQTYASIAGGVRLVGATFDLAGVAGSTTLAAKMPSELAQ
jgi:hypothetical protein